MASFVSSILYNSASKIESISKTYKNNNSSGQYIPSPTYTIIDSSPIPSPSTSWSSRMNILSDKSKEDKLNNVDRHSISQGIKLVSIAADEYEDGNASVALDIYLTGVDKILMALPNKTNINTKMAIKDKLQSVEERVGISLSDRSNKNQLLESQVVEDSIYIDSFILSRITSTLRSISNKAYQQITLNPIKSTEQVETININHFNTQQPIETNEDPIHRFKSLGQFIIQIVVTLTILIKQSPLPDMISFIFSYLIQLLLWIDTQFNLIERVQLMTVYFIKYGIQADERYHIHEYITEAIHMIIIAGLKAVVAFKETPRYRDNPILNPDHFSPPSSPTPNRINKNTKFVQQQLIKNNNHNKPLLNSTNRVQKQKQKSSWVSLPW